MSEAEKYRLIKIELINNVLQQFVGGEDEKILASELMPNLIEAGVFEKNYKNGFPIRCFLEELQFTNRLHLIPFAKLRGGKWYFVFYETTKYKKQNSDENYVINLCDTIFNEKGIRQHTFEFLVGDLNKNGKKKKLPVDAYYPNLFLVIEYMEVYHFISDGTKRNNYDERRRIILRENRIKLLEIEFSDFTYDSKYRIIRREEKDLETVNKLLTNILG